MGGCVACERRNTVFFRAPEVNANINPSLRFSKFAATSSTDLGASRAMLQRRKARWTPSLVPDAARALRARRRSMRKRSTWREQGVRKTNTRSSRLQTRKRGSGAALNASTGRRDFQQHRFQAPAQTNQTRVESSRQKVRNGLHRKKQCIPVNLVEDRVDL